MQPGKSLLQLCLYRIKSNLLPRLMSLSVQWQRGLWEREVRGDGISARRARGRGRVREPAGEKGCARLGLVKCDT